MIHIVNGKIFVGSGLNIAGGNLAHIPSAATPPVTIGSVEAVVYANVSSVEGVLKANISSIDGADV